MIVYLSFSWRPAQILHVRVVKNRFHNALSQATSNAWGKRGPGPRSLWSIEANSYGARQSLSIPMVNEAEKKCSPFCRRTFSNAFHCIAVFLRRILFPNMLKLTRSHRRWWWWIITEQATSHCMNLITSGSASVCEYYRHYYVKTTSHNSQMQSSVVITRSNVAYFINALRWPKQKINQGFQLKLKHAKPRPHGRDM